MTPQFVFAAATGMAQLDAIEALDSEDEVPADLRLLAPLPEGFVMLRALSLEPGQRADAIARLKMITCGVENAPG